ncbi:hypothetical protein B0J15DRAFT_191283 [Fusarium solani]|uniref:Uncharacterized protein n=1 Tax=Fusarium solani TaxID=169388 RepID=A0A9P9RBN6_FUSSL|nr:uncharacterized protein B0J15DRAFT_191283 [Fusarium solani]KAH7272904.1 hypothetical protein B0J15DRAFT_191283 [Fusarium solani]
MTKKDLACETQAGFAFLLHLSFVPTAATTTLIGGRELARLKWLCLLAIISSQPAASPMGVVFAEIETLFSLLSHWLVGSCGTRAHATYRHPALLGNLRIARLTRGKESGQTCLRDFLLSHFAPWGVEDVSKASPEASTLVGPMLLLDTVSFGCR